jgi:hypothetical protein
VSPPAVQEVVRIAAVIHAAAVSAEGAQVLSPAAPEEASA